MNIQEKFQTISLLSKASLSKYAEKGFRYIHYGLIQVAVKPLVHIGVDAPAYLALRDKRLKRYKPSLLAMIQTNICNGPIYFNCAPNYSVSLTDPLIMNSLVLDIHMQGDEFEKLTEQFVVMYRVYYRLLSSQLNPRFKLVPTSRDETVLLHIDAEQSKTFTPKRLKWHEITIPDEFQIENPHPCPDIERKEISQIIEEPNGNVLIRFNSMREHGSSSIPMEPSRHSFAHPRRQSYAESSEQPFRIPNAIHVHHTAPIPEVSTSTLLSPTASQMKGFKDTDFCKISHINVHTNLAKKWKLSDGNIITQIHPPLQSLRLDTPEGELIASPFKKGKDSNDSINMEDIRKIYHQNNYSNQILHTIATQVDSLSSEIKSIPKTNTSRFPASYSAPHFQPSSFSKTQEAQLIRPSSSSVSPPSPLLHKISQTLDKINSNLPTSSHINTIDQENLDNSSSFSDASNRELKEKLHISLIHDDSSSDHHPEDFQDFSSTDEDQKELIFDIIQDLPPEAQKKQLEKLKALILREESSSARLIEPFSISKMFDKYPNLNPPIRQNGTMGLQAEIRSLKAQVKELKERVFSVETKNLELDTQIAVLHSQNSKGKEIIPDSSIPDFTLAEIPMPELRVPWIFCWSYKISQLYPKEFPMSLIREFKIKWWTSYSVELCSQEAVLKFVQSTQQIQRSIQHLTKSAGPSRVVQTPATPVKASALPTPLKPEKLESSCSTITPDDADEAAQFQEWLRFKAVQQQFKQSKSHSPPSSQDSSTEPLGTDPIGGQDPFDF
ncbi:hypothetical protein M9H77_04841 [Catharanthus roseus]|uniref:Uncharacterized protein n=1 Tax=Catharanthus roseus TaxID=4058 RepID=A0ACC0CFN0_CATRO|nr:hypothetical protein M9H77_04841 [Catharanthus roseus]